MMIRGKELEARWIEDGTKRVNVARGESWSMEPLYEGDVVVVVEGCGPAEGAWVTFATVERVEPDLELRRHGARSVRRVSKLGKKAHQSRC